MDHRLYQLLAGGYEESQMPTALVDADLKIRYANKRARALFPHLSVPDGLLMMIPPESVESCRAALFAGCPASAPDASLGMSGRRVDFIPFGAGEQQGAIVHFVWEPASPESAPRKLEGIAQSIAAYDSQLRNAIANIFAMVSVVNQRHKNAQDDSCDTYMDEITNNCYRILRGVVNHTETVRFTSGSNILLPVQTDVWQFLQASFEAMALLTASAGIPLEWELPQTPLFTMVDRQKLLLVLPNIISNCCRFTRDGNRILCSGKETGAGVLVTISDKGLGIPAPYQDRVFDPYFSYDPDGNVFAGMGLGLTVVKQAVVAMGGTVALNSEEGVGTTIAFTLPIVPPEDETLVVHSTAADFLVDRFSPIYVGLSDVCPCPN